MMYIKFTDLLPNKNTREEHHGSVVCFTDIKGPANRTVMRHFINLSKAEPNILFRNDMYWTIETL